MSRTLYLHIGAPKAASTTLQKRLFPALKGISCVSKPRFDLVKRRYSWDGELASFVLAPPSVWDTHGDAFFHRLLAMPGVHGSHPVLISDENMSVNRDILPAHLVAHVARLRDVAGRHGFNRIRVVFITRRQDEWLASAYAQTSDRFPSPGQQDFEHWIQRKIGSEQDYDQRGAALDYAHIHEQLADLLGIDNLLFLPLELLAIQPDLFSSGLFNFLDVAVDLPAEELLNQKMNVRRSSLQGEATEKQWALRSTSFWRRKPVASITLHDSLVRAIMNRYGPGNMTLASRIGLPLEDYGYGPVGSH